MICGTDSTNASASSGSVVTSAPSAASSADPLVGMDDDTMPGTDHAGIGQDTAYASASGLVASANVTGTFGSGQPVTVLLHISSVFLPFGVDVAEPGTAAAPAALQH